MSSASALPSRKTPRQIFVRVKMLESGDETSNLYGGVASLRQDGSVHQGTLHDLGLLDSHAQGVLWLVERVVRSLPPKSLAVVHVEDSLALKLLQANQASASKNKIQSLLDQITEHVRTRELQVKFASYRWHAFKDARPDFYDEWE